nr:lipoprotein [uncultured Acidocella sp.]
MRKMLLPLLLLAGLSGCVMYGAGGGPNGQPYDLNAPPPNPPPPPYPGPAQ